jgi:hypothetical protein
MPFSPTWGKVMMTEAAGMALHGDMHVQQVHQVHQMQLRSKQMKHILKQRFAVSQVCMAPHIA